MKKDTSFVRRLFSHTLLILNLLLIVWTCLCCAAAYISPTKVQYLAITNLTLPFVIILNILFALFWLLISSKKIRFLFSALILLAGYKVFMTVFALNFNTHNDMSKHNGSLKVMSWNVHGMGIFEKHDKKQTGDKILDFIKAENADIVCLPEYYTPRNDTMKPYARNILSSGYSHYRFCFDNAVGTNVYLGTAIFSKYPLENYCVHHLGNEKINVLQFDIRIKDDKMMRVLFLHLHSFGFSDYDKYYIEELKSRRLKISTRSDIFSWKLNYAYGMRATESDTIAKIISSSPYPVLICGDLNDLPGSYTYMKIRGDLRDAFLDKGKWIGRTYNELSPTLRIDYMFYNESMLDVLGYRCPHTNLSDHRPVIVNFKIL